MHVNNTLVVQEQDPDDESRPIIDQEDLKFLVIDMSAVTHVDSAGLRGLEQLLNILQANDIQLLMANPSHTTMNMMEHGGLTDLIGEHCSLKSNRSFIIPGRDLVDSRSCAIPVVLVALPRSHLSISCLRLPFTMLCQQPVIN